MWEKTWSDLVPVLKSRLVFFVLLFWHLLYLIDHHGIDWVVHSFVWRFWAQILYINISININIPIQCFLLILQQLWQALCSFVLAANITIFLSLLFSFQVFDEFCKLGRLEIVTLDFFLVFVGDNCHWKLMLQLLLIEEIFNFLWHIHWSLGHHF